MRSWSTLEGDRQLGRVWTCLNLSLIGKSWQASWLRTGVARSCCSSTMESAVEGKDFNFPVEEQKVLEFWERIDAFKQQLERTAGRKEYVFFDGPPFATGLPHYGHILAGTIKVICARCCCSSL